MSEGGDDRSLLGAPADDPLGQRELFDALRSRLFGRTLAAEHLGRYELRERIGAGGGGIVYRAWDTSLRRLVALKLIRDIEAPDGEQLTQRLRGEARALAQAAHPNVLPIYDVGEDAGRIFVAMELVDGLDLEHWLAVEPRSREEILEVFGEAGRGLAAAHSAGVVHRDFKPANVMVGVDGRVRVMDFGIARLDRADTSTAGPMDDPPGRRSRAGRITQTGAILGTPAYMAPEQWEGASVDAAADQYSYCAALLEALTGALPGDKSPGRSARLGVGLARAIERGLEDDVSARWSSMHDLLAELGRSHRRRSRWLWWGGLTAVGTVAAVVVLARSRTDDCATGRRAVQQLWTASDRDDVAASFSATQLPFARYTWERVDTLLEEHRSDWLEEHESVCRAQQRSQTAQRRRNCLDDGLARAQGVVDAFLGADRTTVQNAVRAASSLPAPRRCAAAPETSSDAPVLEPWRRKLDEAYVLAHTGRYADSVALLEEIVGGTDREQAAVLHARALHRWGVNLHVLSRPEEAAKLLAESAWLADEAGDDYTAAESMTVLILVVGSGLARPDEALWWDRHARVTIERIGGAPELEAERLDNLGVLAYNAGEFDRARELREQALALVSAVLSEQDPAVANYLNGIGNAYYSQGRLEEAEEFYLRVISIREAAYGKDHPMVAHSYNNLGNVRWGLGDDDGARVLYERSAAVQERVFGEHHESVAHAVSNIANLHLSQGDYEKARTLYHRALGIWEVLGGDLHPDIAATLSNLGAAELNTGNDDVARRHLERALAILESTVGSDHPDMANVLTNLAMALSSAGERDRAVAMHRRAMKIHERVYGHDHPMVAMSITNLAANALARDEFDEAARLYGEAAEIRERSQGATHPALAVPLTGLGRTLVHGDRPAEAIAPLRRALALLDGKTVDPLKRGQAQYALARALWRSGGDRAEALALGRAALAAFEEGGDNLAEDVEIVREWLARPR